MAIQKVSSNVQSLLNASARINNFKNAIEELVNNSLDADSSSIAIRVDIHKHWIQVVDNGYGIKNIDFKLLGERYATSKLMDINTLKAPPSKFGFQGQALANIIEISQTVRVTSRCANSNETWLKSFSEGKESECCKVEMRPSIGTTVEVIGFLFNMNIQKRSINAFNELQGIKHFLERLSLVFNNVSISLRDDSNNEIIFKIHKNRDIYQTFKSLFDIDFNDMQELQVQKNDYKVKAFIGIKETGIEKYQWIYINNKFVTHSNLHELINDKLSKALSSTNANNKKIKMKGANSKENNVVRHFIPFYFLFLTCSYYEYDTVSCGKKTIIEFKDWKQINKLTEKLVNFYNGDTNLKCVDNNNTKTQKQVKNIEDTRNEVKKIIEKILGNNNKNPRVSQMKNGVKGKGIKRRNKKEQPKLFLPSPKRNSQNKHINNDNIKLNSPKNKIIRKIPDKHRDSKIHSKSRKISFNSKPIASKKHPKIAKRSLKCKCNKKEDNIVDIFKLNTDTIKNRCKELSFDLMNFKYEINQPAIKQNINMYSVKKYTNDQSSIRFKELETGKKTSEVLKIGHFSHKKPVIEKIRTYDLLQTILKTQQGFNTQDAGKNDTCKINERHENVTVNQNSYCAPKLTFESHKYNIKKTLPQNKKLLNLQFISKQEKDGFNLRTYKNISHFRVKTGKIMKNKNTFKAKTQRKNSFYTYDKLLKKYKQDILSKSFSIDKNTESDVIEYSKYIRKQISNDMKLLLYSHYDGIHSQNKCQENINFEFKFNIESTYTILTDSYQNSQLFCNRRHFNTLPKKTVEEDAENVKCNNKKYIDVMELLEETLVKNDSFTKNKFNAVVISDSQPTTQNNESVEPLNICKVVINSSDELAKEFNSTFNINMKKDYSFKVNCDEKCDINSSQFYNYGILNDNNMNYSQKHNLNNKSVYKDELQSENMGLTDVIVNELNSHGKKKEVINTRNKTFTLYDNSVNNFQIISRHNFMPKGMSPIFTNCFSKNVCSYNLDTEYYEDKIYNNFVKEVAINSEILEPQVQNMKEHATGHIQKVTEKLKKNNAHLIFEIGSLVDAKVLGQVDCKFIAAKIYGQSQTHESSEFLVLFDQHACHERIRLENNLSYYFNGNCWKSTTIEAIRIKVSKDEILYLHNHKDKFTQFGLGWTILNNYEILVNAIPEAILGKNRRPVETITKTIRDLIVEQIHAIKCLKGNVSLYPQSIMNLVFSEACRYAIKFGDMLSKNNCQQLILKLASCKTPFQCAHGRPVMAVMMELKSDKEVNVYKINMQKLMLFKNQMK